ncbi:MAG: HupE/UreJ family protein [Stagnimonas sp.]|nr:HupE/UreJ family protein [Stagnimonas sp.]
MSRLVLGLALLISALSAPAHEFRSAYLEARESGDGQFQLSWRLPATEQRGAVVQLSVPPGCQLQAGPVRSSDRIQVQDYAVDCRGSAAPWWVELSGLRGAAFDALAKYIDARGNEHYQHLQGAQNRLPLAPVAPPEDKRHNNLFLEGINHVLTGYDHLLYLGLLFLFLRHRKSQLALGVTVFTLAHSLSLGLSVFGLLRVPARPVEAVIALTISYFALALIRGERPIAGSAWRWQLVIFGCGLIHGLGFANSLAEVGFEHHDLLWGLLSFNLGLEAAQSLLLLAAAGLGWLGHRLWSGPTVTRLEPLLAGFAGSIGVYWYLQRLLG